MEILATLIELVRKFDGWPPKKPTPPVTEQTTLIGDLKAFDSDPECYEEFIEAVERTFALGKPLVPDLESYFRELHRPRGLFSLIASWTKPKVIVHLPEDVSFGELIDIVEVGKWPDVWAYPGHMPFEHVRQRSSQPREQ